MRVTRDHVPQPPRQVHLIRVPEDPTFWIALALLGVALACSLLHPVTVVAGVTLSGLALYRLGRIDARRPAAPVRAPVADAPAGLGGPAQGARREDEPPAPAAARPSAAFRGGGVPGGRGPAAADPLDAPIDHADRTLTTA